MGLNFRFAGLALLVALLSMPAIAQTERLQSESVQAQIKALPETAGQLFADMPGSDLERPQATERRVKRSRTVRVNGAYIAAMLEAPPLEVTASGTLARDTRQHILNLFDDVSVGVVKLSQRRDELGNTVWVGGIIDDPMGNALIVIDKGEITASISTNGRNITVFPGADGVHTIREMKPRSSSELTDPSSRDSNDAIKPPKPAGGAVDEPTSPSAESPERTQATTTLRLFVAYTAKAKARVSNISTSVSLALAHLNTTLSNSNIDVQASLVGFDQVTYTEGTTASADNDLLNDARIKTGDFARIHLGRAATQADLVAVIADYGTVDSCGVGYINDDLTSALVNSYAQYGVSLTDVTCLPSTFTHEVGHNLGANHDRYVITNPVPGPTGYNYGYIDTTAKFMDVMAYNNQCDDLNITCTEILYYSNPNINYNGRPIGVADNLPTAANNSRRIGEIAPLIARFRTALSTTSPTLSVLVSGTGTVTSSPTGINCGTVCTYTFTSGASVTLTAAAPRGSQFTGWSGGSCSGTGTCTVTVSSASSVTANFTPALRVGAVYSSAQSGSQSLLRFANTGSTSGSVSVVLSNYATGAALGTWSKTIPAGVADQVGIETIESAIPSGTTKPQYYSASVQSSMTGYIQHVLFRRSDGTLTNLSTCDVNVTANATQVANVHSSLLDFGYPSSIAITNTATLGSSSATSTVSIGVFDSATGTRIGTYTTTVAANTQKIVPVADIETAMGTKPTSTQYHYTLKIENSFLGHLQHLVNNSKVGVITDMTTQCSFNDVTAPPSTVAVRQPGPIFSSTGTSQSFLRFYNTGTTAGTVNVALYNYSTGTSLGNWTSPSIPAGSSAQYQITTPETVVTATKPLYYATSLQTQITGYFQHVLYRPSDGTLTNLSTCDTGVTAEQGQLINVHSTLLDFGFPSSVVINNTATTAATATLGIYDATTGTKLGTYTSASIPAGAQVIVPITDIQTQGGVSPTSTQYHYVIKVENSFTGFIQHLVNNKSVGVITDMTAMCLLPSQKATVYTDCRSTSCSATVGTAVNGQMKKLNDYQNYRYTLTAGQAYTIEVKGASSNNGTFVRPYVFIFGPSGSVVTQGGGGGTGTDVRLTYTPTTTGAHTVQIGHYLTANNAGTFVLTVN
ncbi:MAG: hypothetical protein JNM81_04925 [Rhodospirillaceae bacterium]|nr:hypothetical protein [Rhodospirillaceae bacterium]